MRTPLQLAADLSVFLLCLLRLLALWVFFIAWEIAVFAKLKKLHLSKTMWLGALVALAPQLPGLVDAVAPLIGPNAVQKAGVVIGALIWAARLATKVPLEQK